MDDRSVARPDLERLDPLVLREVGLYLEVLIRNLAASWDRELCNRHDCVRLTHAPAPQVVGRLGQVLWIALRGPSIDPTDDRVFLARCEPALVEPLPVCGVGMPRRHHTREDIGSNRACPGSRLLIREQRHRRDLAGPVTRSAVLVEDGRDVPGVGWLSRGRARGGRLLWSPPVQPAGGSPQQSQQDRPERRGDVPSRETHETSTIHRGRAVAIGGPDPITSVRDRAAAFERTLDATQSLMDHLREFDGRKLQDVARPASRSKQPVVSGGGLEWAISDRVRRLECRPTIS